MIVQKYKIVTKRGEQFAIRFKPDKFTANRYGVVDFIGVGQVWDTVEALMLEAYGLKEIEDLDWFKSNHFCFSHRCTFKKFKESIVSFKRRGFIVAPVKSFGRLIR